MEKNVLINEEFILEEGDSFEIVPEALSAGQKRAARIKTKRQHDKGFSKSGKKIKKGKTAAGKIDRRKSGARKKPLTGKKKAELKKKAVKRAKTRKRSDREDKAVGRK